MKVISQQTEIFKQAIGVYVGPDASYVQTSVTLAKMPVNGSLETVRIDNVECIMGFDAASILTATSGGFGTIEYIVSDNDMLATDTFVSPHAMYYKNQLTPNINGSVQGAAIVVDSTEIQKGEGLIIKPQIAIVPTFKTGYKRSASIAVFVILQVTYSKIKITSDEYIALFAA